MTVYFKYLFQWAYRQEILTERGNLMNMQMYFLRGACTIDRPLPPLEFLVCH